MGQKKVVLFSEVSSFQRLKCMQECYLGWEKVSCLEKRPQFKYLGIHIHHNIKHGVLLTTTQCNVLCQ